MAKKYKHDQIKLPLREKIGIVIFLIVLFGAAVGFGFLITGGFR